MKVRRNNGDVLSEINIIPLVDVMLVLLIIFMITAPMMHHGVKVDVPKMTAKPLPQKDEPQILYITKNEELILNEKRIKLSDLKPALSLIFSGKPEAEIYLKADKNVSYGFVVKCMGIIREAGIERINIVTRPEEE
ncbi:MAG: biopolymer transporter ExbD [Desulfobacterota bacterium]|nr:biopolymer transporter ExbD [Thermodesulfobacteriota bacterium]MDW8001078.1 biopolymer transporter ExbD [Deltaproteobacteria bacterium]